MSVEEFDELVYFISGMKKSFNRKLDDHLFIIQQQQNKIDQMSHIIDELSWQLRELRDSVRQVNEKSEAHCKCDYANHISKSSQNKLDNKDKNLAPYEGLFKINFFFIE